MGLAMRRGREVGIMTWLSGGRSNYASMRNIRNSEGLKEREIMPGKIPRPRRQGAPCFVLVVGVEVL